MNKVILIGRLTKDPDLRFAAGTGTAVCKFTLAVNRMKKDDPADFINCIAFGKQGETVAQYMQKGQLFAITGRIQTGSYINKDNQKVYTTDVVVDGFDFVDSSKKEGNNNTNSNNNNYNNSNGNPNNSYDDMTPIDEGDIPF